MLPGTHLGIGRRLVHGGFSRRSRVAVEVLRGGEAVMAGTLTCFTLDRHVLDREGPP
jgi:hypothetical protein